MEVQDVVVGAQRDSDTIRLMNQCKRTPRFIIDKIQNIGDTAVFLYRFPRDFSAQRQILVRDRLRGDERLIGTVGKRFGSICSAVVLRFYHVLRLNRLCAQNVPWAGSAGVAPNRQLPARSKLR